MDAEKRKEERKSFFHCKINIINERAKSPKSLAFRFGHRKKLSAPITFPFT